MTEIETLLNQADPRAIEITEIAMKTIETYKRILAIYERAFPQEQYIIKVIGTTNNVKINVQNPNKHAEEKDTESGGLLSVENTRKHY